MQIPTLDDTIVAIATGWAPSPLAIVRLSGPESLALAAKVVGDVVAGGRPAPTLLDVRLRVDEKLEVPATLFIFRAPRSYAGQDLIEFHVPGCLPLVRQVAEQLIGSGARLALPGEFTARAFLNGKLDAAEIERVSGILSAGSAAELREAQRGVGAERQRRLETLRSDILETLSLVEAGIDFVEEDDIRFVQPAELLARLHGLLKCTHEALAGRRDVRRAIPHVALAGCSNAGKSTLFNALLGEQRTIVSAMPGSTRDVVSAEVTIGGVRAVLQDVAGLREAADELEQAAHVAAERSRELADVVVWVHAANEPWSNAERLACERIPPERRLLVVNKCDLATTEPVSSPEFVRRVDVSALRGDGIAGVGELLAGSLGADVVGTLDHELRACRAALELAFVAAEQSAGDELVAAELRNAYSHLDSALGAGLTDAVLGHIFGKFCIGK